MKIEVELESDGRWIAEMPAVPGAMAYGSNRAEAVYKVEALVLRILADRAENSEDVLAYAGIFQDSREESARIMKTIESGCEQVKPEDWRSSDGKRKS